MVKTKRFGAQQIAQSLRWDGSCLLGEAAAKQVDVLLPARFVSFRSESFPAAAQQALVSAARLRGQRAFANLGPVVVDAIFSEQREAKVTVLLVAIPTALLTTIKALVEEKGLSLRSLRVEELMGEIPNGGLLVNDQQASLVDYKDGMVHGLSVLGLTTHAQFDSLLERERSRMQIDATAVGGFIENNSHNFAHSSLEQKPSVLQNDKLRVYALAGIIVFLLLGWLWLSSVDVQAQRDEIAAELKELRPIADILEQRRADIKETAAWFDKRPRLTPLLFAIAETLPALSASDQVHVTRVRQLDSVQGLAEGVAEDRAQLLRFIQRLRTHVHIEKAELRSSRKQDKKADVVSFEVVFVLREAMPLRLPASATPENIESTTHATKESIDAGT